MLTSEDGTNKYCLTYQSANNGQLNKNENRPFLNQDHLFVSLNSITCHRTVQHHSSKFAFFGQTTNHYRHSRGLINFELIRQSKFF